MIVLYSARYFYQGEDRLDVTRQGDDPVGRVLAPSWDLLWPFIERRRAAKGEVSLEEWMRYFDGYAAEMRASLRRDRAAWARVLTSARPDPQEPSLAYVTLVCHCADPLRCHRTAAGIFLAATFRDQCEFHGECEPARKTTGVGRVCYRGRT